MTVEIRPLVPAEMSDAEVEAYQQVRVLAVLTDRPQDSVPGREDSLGLLLTPIREFGPCRFWAAYVDGLLVGVATLGMPSAENSHLGVARIEVHADYRRRGIGTDLLRVVVPVVREAGRRTIMGGGVKGPSACSEWGRSLGFVETQSVVQQRLTIANMDRRRWSVDTPPGYRLVRWAESAPEELVASFAVARQAILDAPDPGKSFQEIKWSAQRVREEEENHRRRNIEVRVVAAVSEQSGDVAGITEMLIFPESPEDGAQQDTAVLAAHRGCGLGVCMKAAMMNWLLAERPAMAHVMTTIDSGNVHMIRVNDQIGYETTSALTRLEADVQALAERLDVQTR